MFASEMSLNLNPERAMAIVLDAIQEVIPFELAVIMSLENDNALQIRKE